MESKSNGEQQDERHKPFTVTKRDAARRQIETAINLWLNDSDPVAVHTLAAAAHSMLHELGAAQGKPATLLNDELWELIGLSQVMPDHKSKIKKSQNFFKHAKSDPDEALTFKPKLNEIILADTLRSHLVLFGVLTPLMTAFFGWYMLHHPDCLEPEIRQTLPPEGPEAWPDKREYFAYVLLELGANPVA